MDFSSSSVPISGLAYRTCSISLWGQLLGLIWESSGWYQTFQSIVLMWISEIKIITWLYKSTSINSHYILVSEIVMLNPSCKHTIFSKVLQKFYSHVKGIYLQWYLHQKGHMLKYFIYYFCSKLICICWTTLQLGWLKKQHWAQFFFSLQNPIFIILFCIYILLPI